MFWGAVWFGVEWSGVVWVWCVAYCVIPGEAGLGLGFLGFGVGLSGVYVHAFVPMGSTNPFLANSKRSDYWKVYPQALYCCAWVSLPAFLFLFCRSFALFLALPTRSSSDRTGPIYPSYGQR